MGQIHNIEKLTDCKFLNLYHLNATSVHNTPVSYFVASRAKSINELKIKTGKNTPDGVIIYSLYGEKRDRVVLVRSVQIRNWWIYLRIPGRSGRTERRIP